MKIIALAMDPRIYSSNAYLVLGSWNRLDDVNTLVDTGNNPGILEQFAGINTGVGKRAVEQIVLTHSHFDHKGLLERLIDIYNPSACAFAPFEGVSRTLKNNQRLRMGDRSFEVIHTPGHSNDSLCFYCAEEGVLFSGDMPLHIMTTEGIYPGIRGSSRQDCLSENFRHLSRPWKANHRAAVGDHKGDTEKCEEKRKSADRFWNVSRQKDPEPYPKADPCLYLFLRQ